MAPPKDSKSARGAGSSSRNPQQRKNGDKKNTSHSQSLQSNDYHGQHGSSYERGSSSTQGQGELPKSVRNAPPELRPLIRRRQNNESAKRSRERKKEEQEEMQKMFEANSVRIDRLEKAVGELEAEVEARKNNKDSKHGSSRDRKDRRDDPGASSTKSGFYGDPF